MSQPVAEERWTEDNGRGGVSTVAVTLLTLALLLELGYTTFYFARERRNLQTVRENQQTPLHQAERTRAQFDSIARRTLQLAQQGNAAAAIIAENLARRGITISPDLAPQTPSSDAPPPAK